VRPGRLAALLLAPTALFLAVFFAYPLVEAVALAFRSGQGHLTLEHFRRLADDVYFPRAVRNTLVLLAWVIPIQLVLALLAALVVSRRMRGSGTFLYVYALPLGISELAAGLIWLSVFTERGYLNTVLDQLGWLERPVVYLSFQSPGWLLAALVVAEAWRATPLVMMILVAGMQMIARDYLEAADTFGATGWQKLRYVILPLLKPSLQTALLIRTVLALQVFAPVVVLTGRLFPVLASEAYFWYSLIRNPHVAAVYAVAIMGVSVAVSWLYLLALRTREEQVGA